MLKIRRSLGRLIFEAGAFCGLNEVSTLHLKFNKLTSLPQLCSLKDCLVNLQIGNSKISRWINYSFKGFKKLQIINFNHNDPMIFSCCRIYIGSSIHCHIWWRIRTNFNPWMRCKHPGYVKDWTTSRFLTITFINSMSLFCITCLNWNFYG